MLMFFIVKSTLGLGHLKSDKEFKKEPGSKQKFE